MIINCRIAQETLRFFTNIKDHCLNLRPEAPPAPPFRGCPSLCPGYRCLSCPFMRFPQMTENLWLLSPPLQCQGTLGCFLEISFFALSQSPGRVRTSSSSLSAWLWRGFVGLCYQGQCDLYQPLIYVWWLTILMVWFYKSCSPRRGQCGSRFAAISVPRP